MSDKPIPLTPTARMRVRLSHNVIIGGHGYNTAEVEISDDAFTAGFTEDGERTDDPEEIFEVATETDFDLADRLIPAAARAVLKASSALAQAHRSYKEQETNQS